ncbi:hypothetical protein [Alistipes timonensis]|uniref:hypothetical protein n=1 Tax=Alistipes timonensis TaxID=1465754 RepID=UPI00266F2577|nr:hypothetical protein [Alistipes timonensis]
MTITQIQFLKQFSQHLVDNGFELTDNRHIVVLVKRIRLSDYETCRVEISWLPKSWPVVKVQIRIGSILIPYDVTVGLLMDYKGGPDEILAQLVREATEGLADIIIKQL